jgi:hypothetical protein
MEKNLPSRGRKQIFAAMQIVSGIQFSVSSFMGHRLLTFQLLQPSASVQGTEGSDGSSQPPSKLFSSL